MAPTNPLGKKRPMPLGLPRLYMLMSCWGVREKVSPLMSVGMLLMKVSGTAMLRGSLFTKPWSSDCSQTLQLEKV